MLLVDLALHLVRVDFCQAPIRWIRVHAKEIFRLPDWNIMVPDVHEAVAKFWVEP